MTMLIKLPAAVEIKKSQTCFLIVSWIRRAGGNLILIKPRKSLLPKIMELIQTRLPSSQEVYSCPPTNKQNLTEEG